MMRAICLKGEKNSRKDLFDYQPRSGTKVAYDYVAKKKRTIINKLYCTPGSADAWTGADEGI